MEAEVIYYCEDHDSVDFTILSETFGSPEDIANDFLAELGVIAVKREGFIKRHLLRFIMTIVFITMLLVAGVGIHTYYVQNKLLNGHYVESITYEETITPYATAPIYSVETFGD